SIGRRDYVTHSLHVLVNVGELPPGRERFPADETYSLLSFPSITGFIDGTEHALLRLGNDPATLRYLDRQGINSEIAAPIIMCDVDELKIVNDTLGHAVGDRVLLDTANALRSAVAGLEAVTICRIGGDEFCVVLERGGLLHAQAVADRVAQIVARAENHRSV